MSIVASVHSPTCSGDVSSGSEWEPFKRTPPAKGDLTGGVLFLEVVPKASVQDDAEQGPSST
jgi:hypothetical protein